MYKRHHFMLMSALGVALSAGAGAIAAAFDSAEKFIVTGALKTTHTITEQVCDFDTLDQLEGFLAEVADRHNWFRHDQPAAVLTGSSAQLVSSETAGDLTGLIVGDVAGAADPLAQRAALVAEQIDTTAAQVDTLAQGPAPSPTVDADLAADPASASSATVDVQSAGASADDGATAA